MTMAERKAFNKREKIIKSAIKIVNRRGYSGTTMEEVAAELLMTKGSLYYYFKNKSDLMFQCNSIVLLEAQEDLKRVLLDESLSIKKRLQEMVFIHIHYAIEENEVFNLIMRPEQLFSEEQLEEVLHLRDEYAAFFDKIIAKGIETKDFNTEDPIMLRMFILGAMNWIQQWYKPNGRLSKKEIQQRFWNYILKLLT